jgi:pimeloyl-ACP methyl ester carboxylesterase
MAMQTKPSIVFVHGLWADGSCFSKLIPALQAEGYEVLSTQNSLDSLHGDVTAITRALGRVGRPAILVGHSYGGTVITAAGTDERVAGLVYIAALAPGRERDVAEPAESVPHHRRVRPHPSRRGARLAASRRHWVLRGGPVRSRSSSSCGRPRACQGVPDVDLFNQQLGGTAWWSKPSWYTVAKNDRTVHSELQRFVAKRMGATTYEVESSHVPMLSHPDLVLDVIRAAAQAVE